MLLFVCVRSSSLVVGCWLFVGVLADLMCVAVRCCLLLAVCSLLVSTVCCCWLLFVVCWNCSVFVVV